MLKSRHSGLLKISNVDSLLCLSLFYCQNQECLSSHHQWTIACSPSKMKLHCHLLQEPFPCLIPKPGLRIPVWSKALCTYLWHTSYHSVLKRWYRSSLKVEEMLLPSVFSGTWHRACNILNPQLSSMNVDLIISFDLFNNPGKLLLFLTVLVESSKCI